MNLGGQKADALPAPALSAAAAACCMATLAAAAGGVLVASWAGLVACWWCLMTCAPAMPAVLIGEVVLLDIPGPWAWLLRDGPST
jgi:hypothetical protein